LKDFLVDNYSLEEEIIIKEEENEKIKLYDLKEQIDSRRVTLEYL
jgi:hypothetical protein